MADAAPRDAVIFLTHRWDGRLARHYAKFRREASRVLPVYLVFHAGGAETVPAAVAPDIVVTNQAIGAAFPAAAADLFSAPPQSLYNYLNLIWLTAFTSPALSGYDRLWMIEYDVDYSGDWGGFFRQTAGYGADLIGTHLRTRRQEPTWMWLGGIVDPLGNVDDHLMGFFPVVRLTRAAIDVLAETYRRWLWRGNFELVMPTVLRRAGLSIAEIGGWNDLTPAERRGLHYEGDFTTGTKGFYSFGVGPAMQHYFAESRLGFWDRNRLYHPVKTGLTGYEAFIIWWLKFRDDLRRRLFLRDARRRQIDGLDPGPR